MTEMAISPLRQRLIEDMTIRRLGPKPQHHYIGHVKSFADFLGRSADTATAEDVHRYQLRLALIGATVPTLNVSATALRFFFKVTLKRSDLADEVVSAREPRRLPVVLSPDEVGRLLTSATNIKHKAVLSLAYATGLRASEVVSPKLTDIDSERMVIRVEQGKSLPLRKRGAGRIDMSCSRPTLSGYCVNGGAPRARRDGCIPATPDCSPATADSIRVRANCTASFAWQRGVPASANASVFIRCGTALPRISWSKRPISGSFRFCSKQRHTARRHSIEGRIYYPFHPRCGEPVLIAKQYACRGAELVVISQPDGSVACIPAWMTQESAAQHQLRAEPRLSSDILRSLRAEIDMLLGFLQSDSGVENTNNEAQERKYSGGPVRAGRASRVVSPLTVGTAGNASRSPAARDSGGAGKRGGRR